ncbi:MAG: CesT family type III secretion system chaperone [Puniceicoccales bacterium]|jgi:hypothetical protein|nr:CesT family type III secretion system chaperone [Puniceicoccales bacterium]
MAEFTVEYADAVDAVSELFRIDQWAEDECGERSAIVDGEMEIRVFHAKQDLMVVQGMFGEPMESISSANAAEGKLRYILQANFIRIIHSDDVLSLDKKTGRLAITRRIPLRDVADDFVIESIESFIGNIDFWDMALKRKQSSAMISPLLGFFGRK